MPLIFEPSAVPSTLAAPKDLKLNPLRAQDYLSDGVTLRTATYDGTQVLLDGSALFAFANAKALDLTFDASNSPLLLLTDTSDGLHFYDGSVTDLSVTGFEPRIHNDRQTEPTIVVAYRRGNDVFYREYADGTLGTETQVPDLQVRTLTGAALGTNDRFQFRGLPVTAAAQPTGSGEATVAPPNIAQPFRPDFFRILKHLLPRARAWRITIDKTLRRTIEGLSKIGKGVKIEADLAFLDIDPQTTRRLADWERQFNLRAGSLTEQQRRDRLEATWSAKGSLAPRNLENLLQGLGFNVYVHDWWVPGSEPAVNSHAAATVRNPFTYLAASNNLGTTGTDCGDTLMECGEEFAECGNSNTPQGYPLVNKIRETAPDDITGCGEPDMECGEVRAECGEFNQIIDRYREYQLPVDPTTWSGFVYIGGETFPDLATVPLSRRDEFEAALLKYCPAHLWIGVLVTYS